MPLTGQAKADYQRVYMKEYMRNRRAGLNKALPELVKTQPIQVVPVKTVPLRPEQPKSQSYNPMMVGYVPPED